MATADLPADDLKSAVRDKYAALATDDEPCCGSSGCGNGDLGVGANAEYDEAIAAHADLDLGCGRPTDHATLKPGERILDLGSGAGMDAFVARRDVGPDGHVHGVDLAADMVEKARANADSLDYDNVTFEVGDIENLPVETNAFDVILSNCVLNLVPNKARAFAEVARVLRPGGRFSVSDIVHVGSLPNELREAAELYVGCVAGTINQNAYLDRLRDAGFTDVRVTAETPVPLPDALLAKHLNDDQVSAFRSNDAALRSVTVVGTHPST